MSRLGDRISEIFGKLGFDDDTYALLEGYVKSKLSDRSLADVNLFESVASLNGWRALNESALGEGDLDRKERWRNSKGLQAVFGYRYPGGLSMWKTLLISILGSVVVTVVIPVLVAGFGASASAVAVTALACKILWVGRGTAKVLLSRWVNKAEEDKFFNFRTCFELLLVIGIPAVFQIGAVREWLTAGFKDFCSAVGLDKAFDAAEDWFNRMIEKFTGKDFAHYTVEERIVEVDKGFERIDGIDAAVSGSPEGAGGFENLLARTGVNYDGSDAKSYIADVIDRLKDKFTVTADKMDSAKEWLDKIADSSFRSSNAMQDAMAGTYKGDNLMFVIDGRRLPGSMSMKEFTRMVTDALTDKGVEGAVVNGISDQLHNATNAAAGSVEVLMFDCTATAENIGKVKDIISAAVEDAGADAGLADTFCKIANADVVDAAGGSAGSVTGSAIETVHDIVINHIWFKTAAEAFTPTYMPVLSRKLFDVRLGSNTTGAKKCRVTDIRAMSYRQLNAKGGINEMIEKENTIRAKKAKQIQAEIEALKNELAGLTKGSDEYEAKKKEISAKKRSIQKEIQKYNEDSVGDRKVLVFFGDFPYFKNEDDRRNRKVSVMKNEPLFMLNPNTLQGQDIAVHYNKRRRRPYYIKGLFSRLEFLPSSRPGSASKEEIAEFLNASFGTWIRLCADNVGMNTIADMKDGKFVPLDPVDAKRPDIGNFTNEEFCKVFNKTMQPYRFLSGEYADDSLLGNKNLKHSYIEKRNMDNDDYINRNIIPWICDKNGPIYKDIQADKTLSRYALDKDGEVRKDLVSMIGPVLYRTGSSYINDTRRKQIADRIAPLFKDVDGNDQRPGKQDRDRKIAGRLVDIVWRHYPEMPK